MALQRALLGFRPDYAESGWAIEPEFGAHAPGQWFEVHRDDTIHYVLCGEHGRFSIDRPAECRDEGLVVIKAPSGRITTLRNFLRETVRDLNDRDPRDCRFRADAIDKLPLLYEMDQPEFEAREIARFLAYFAENRRKQEPLKSFLESYALELRSRFVDFRVHGALVAGLVLLARVCALAVPEDVFAIFKNGRPAPVANIKYFVEAVLHEIIAQRDGSHWVVAACEQLQRDGERMHELAERADSIGQFYGRLYESIPIFLAAYRGFEFLNRHSIAVDPGVQVKVSENVCNERVAVSDTSTWVEFDNSLDNRAILMHRNLVKQAQEKGGEFSAQRLAKQFIQYCLYYPRFFEPFLLGRSGTLTLKRPAAEASVGDSFTHVTIPEWNLRMLLPRMSRPEELRVFVERAMMDRWSSGSGGDSGNGA